MTDQAITDSDLLEKLAALKGSGSVKYKLAVAAIEAEQVKRNTDRAAADEKGRALAAMSRVGRRRAVIKEVIESEVMPTKANLGFLPSPLAICSLPHNRIEAAEFVRRQGNMQIVVGAGHLSSPDGQRLLQPIPYGAKARLILAHLSSEAMRNNSPEVETAGTLSGFIREMGFEVTGGQNGTVRLFKEQLNALAACHMEFTEFYGKSRSLTVRSLPIDSFGLWFGDRDEQKGMFPETIRFSDSFFEELKKHPLPIDRRGLRAFANSSRKLDLFVWLIYRSTQTKNPLVLSWEALRKQFGTDKMRPHDFKRMMTKELGEIGAVYPKLRATLSERGLSMLPQAIEDFGIPRVERPKRISK